MLLEILTGMEEVDIEKREVDFSFIGLEKAKVPWWKFDGGLLEEIHLDEAYLSGASFRNCNLNGATVINAIADRAYFCNTILDNTKFASADLTAANFDKTIIRGVDYHRADLTRADFSNAVLTQIGRIDTYTKIFFVNIK